jgi:aspartate dehydrogenase
VIAVGVIGHGAIGSVVAAALVAGDVPGCRLASVLRRSRAPAPAPAPPAPHQVGSIDDLVAGSQVVVEAAGAAALTEHGPTVVGAGRDLLVASVGALADDALRGRLTGGTGGRLLLSSGAIGGLDLLRAATLLGPVHSVRLTTVKHPRVLVRPWMPDDFRHRLAAAADDATPVTVFSGPARLAVTLFPESANVAATLALATVGFDATHVELLADPGATRVRHHIAVEADAGRYELTVENTPSANPRTSAVAAYALVRALRDLSSNVVVGA